MGRDVLDRHLEQLERSPGLPGWKPFGSELEQQLRKGYSMPAAVQERTTALYLRDLKLSAESSATEAAISVLGHHLKFKSAAARFTDKQVNQLMTALLVLLNKASLSKDRAARLCWCIAVQQWPAVQLAPHVPKTLAAMARACVIHPSANSVSRECLMAIAQLARMLPELVSNYPEVSALPHGTYTQH